MSKLPKLTPPPGWCDDQLTHYVEQAHHNRWATFVHERSAVELLIRIDTWLDKLRSALINPKQSTAAPLFMRAQLLFRTTCDLALSGNLFGCMPMQRTCVEAAAYGVWCGKDQEAAEIWEKRDESEADRKTARRKFMHVNTCKALAEYDIRLSEVYSTIYDRAIDFGAHPNPIGIWANAEIKPAGENYEIAQVGLHGLGPSLTAALRSTSQAGIFVMRAADLVWPERVMLTGLGDELRRLKQTC